MRARKRDGSFREPFDPTASGYGSDYTEGNAWQYSWYVPQDVAGLAAAHGGDDKLLAKLDEVFDAKVDPKIFEHMEDITGLIGWYAHGNEPSHHVAYLYAYAGQPWRTQERLGQIMATQYAPRPDGLAGNDDLGQMSAWYVFTALGFYPVAPGSNEYVIGRPFLPRATLQPAQRQALHRDRRRPRRGASATSARSRSTASRWTAPSSATRKSWPAASCASRCRRSRTATGRLARMRSGRIRCRCDQHRPTARDGSRRPQP